MDASVEASVEVTSMGVFLEASRKLLPRKDGSSMYDPRPMSDKRSDTTDRDHTRYTFFMFRLKLEPEILHCQILSSV